MKLYDKLKELEKLKTADDSGIARQRGLDFEKLVRDLFAKKQIAFYNKTNRLSYFR